LEFSKAKNCPFCGGEPILMYKYSSYGYIFGFVQCQTCGASTKAKRVYGNPQDDDFYSQFEYEEVLRLWERRCGEER